MVPNPTYSSIGITDPRTMSRRRNEWRGSLDTDTSERLELLLGDSSAIGPGGATEFLARASLGNSGPSKSRYYWLWGPLSTVANTGLTARDHLANERTVLAWLRTAVVLATLGMTLLQMSSLRKRARAVVDEGHVTLADPLKPWPSTIATPIGLLPGIASLVIAALGYGRYVRVQHGLRQAEFPAARYSVLLAMGLVLALLLMVTVIDSVF